MTDLLTRGVGIVGNWLLVLVARPVVWLVHRPIKENHVPRQG